MPAFTGKPLLRDAIYWEHEGNRAIRVGDWKLVSKHGSAWELYDISSDRVESTNLAAQHSDKVQELAARYDAWAKRANVLPWPVASPEKRE